MKDSEIAAIAEFLELDIYEFTEKYTILVDSRRGLSLKENSNGSCIFFRENPPECLIEAVKPQQCRDFPLHWNFEGWEHECRGMILNKSENDATTENTET